ncbi:hypothetical protein [Ferrimicrobium sp.]|uniref:hypothetical protein n=1 Tax=Ferrimicrobium sp. TaxID=2926050 RepID=UPI002605E539|nr:hypothetical protein [Ferrimicrobium sp.]
MMVSNQNNTAVRITGVRPSALSSVREASRSLARHERADRHGGVTIGALVTPPHPDPDACNVDREDPRHRWPSPSTLTRW